MRRPSVVVGLVAAACLDLVAASSAMSGDKSMMRDAPIVGIAVAGTLVAATFDESTTDCFHAELWNAASNKVTRFGKWSSAKRPAASAGLRWSGTVSSGQRMSEATSAIGRCGQRRRPKALGTVLGVRLAWAIGPTLHWRPAATAFAPLG